MQREFSTSEIKHIRRREYYNRRVKADFAPPKIEIEIPEIIRRLDDPDGGGMTPETRKREEERLEYLIRLKKKNEEKKVQ